VNAGKHQADVSHFCRVLSDLSDNCEQLSYNRLENCQRAQSVLYSLLGGDMVSYVQIVQRLPQEWQMTMVELVEAVERQLREQLAVRREDIEALSAEVRKLAQAQARTEAQVGALAEAQARTEATAQALVQAQARMEEEFRQYREASEARFARIEAALDRLAEAQARTEEELRQYREASEARFARIEAALDRLAEAQARTEKRVDELAKAQARTEKRVDELAEAQARTEAALRQLAEAQVRTEERVDELAKAQARTEKRVDELAQAQARTEAALRQLAEAQARTEKRVDELAEAQARTEQTLQALIAAHQKLEVRVGRMDGELLEIRYERRATAYFGRVLRRVRVVEVPELLDTLEARLTPEEVDEVLNLDLLVVGRPRRPGAMPEERDVWLAVEISATVDTEDVERAAERATLLRKAGYAAIPAVAGREATSIAEEAAQGQGVLLVRDGRVDFWDQALTRWRE